MIIERFKKRVRLKEFLYYTLLLIKAFIFIDTFSLRHKLSSKKNFWYWPIFFRCKIQQHSIPCMTYIFIFLQLFRSSIMKMTIVQKSIRNFRGQHLFTANVWIKNCVLRNIFIGPYSKMLARLSFGQLFEAIYIGKQIWQCFIHIRYVT